jgi:Tat protein secretion system quality control protein TatD with DNase activity
MGDRSGGREVKGASLKKSKKNPGGVNARGKKAEKVYSGPAESAATPSPGPELYIDCGAALLSRQFERDRDRVLERARTDGNVAAIVLWFSDVEKQQLLSDVCKDNSGLCYNVVGVHPDNIDRTNKRSHETWIIKIEEIARKPECVGILSGYNLGRDLATHFAQESLLKSSCALCDKLHLPLVLHVADGESLLKCIDILRSEGWTGDSPLKGEASDNSRTVILHDALTSCGGDAIKMEAAAKAGFLCSISAAGLTDPDTEIRTRSRECIACIPIGQLLVCSDSPWRTPQNLPDPYLRTLRNEPSNLPSIVVALSEAMGCDTKELGNTLRANSIRAFGMGDIDILESDQIDGSIEEIVVVKKIHDGKVSKMEDVDEVVRKGKKKSKAALLQIFAQNDKKKKEKEENRHMHSEPESESDEGDHHASEVTHHLTSHTQSSHYNCHKCRAVLFSQVDVLAHTLGAARTVFKVSYSSLRMINPPLFLLYFKHLLHRITFPCKVGEEGLCKSTLFLSYLLRGQDDEPFKGDDLTTKTVSGKKASTNDVRKGRAKSNVEWNETGDKKGSNLNMTVCGVTVECSSCGVKLGRFSEVESPCSCGIMVPGPALRINAAKV